VVFFVIIVTTEISSFAIIASH